jgi:hypothetical protein
MRDDWYRIEDINEYAAELRREEASFAESDGTIEVPSDTPQGYHLRRGVWYYVTECDGWRVDPDTCEIVDVSVKVAVEVGPFTSARLGAALLRL